MSEQKNITRNFCSQKKEVRFCTSLKRKGNGNGVRGQRNNDVYKTRKEVYKIQSTSVGLFGTKYQGSLEQLCISTNIMDLGLQATPVHLFSLESCFYSPRNWSKKRWGYLRSDDLLFSPGRAIMAWKSNLYLALPERIHLLINMFFGQQ